MKLNFVFGALCLLMGVFGKKDKSKDVGTVAAIDLGTTYSCVVVYKNGRVDIIANDQGNRITPSHVAFTPDGERLISEAAKKQLTTNPDNTVFDAKRHIGREWSDTSVQHDIKFFTFTVKEKNRKPHIEVKTLQGNKVFAPEEISAMVLGKMKETAGAYLGKNISKSVFSHLKLNESFLEGYYFYFQYPSRKILFLDNSLFQLKRCFFLEKKLSNEVWKRQIE